VRFKLSRKADYEKDLEEGKINPDGKIKKKVKNQNGEDEKDIDDMQEDIIELNAYEKKKDDVPIYIHSKVPDKKRLIEIQNMVKQTAMVRA